MGLKQREVTKPMLRHTCRRSNSGKWQDNMGTWYSDVEKQSYSTGFPGSVLTARIHLPVSEFFEEIPPHEATGPSVNKIEIGFGESGELKLRGYKNVGRLTRQKPTQTSPGPEDSDFFQTTSFDSPDWKVSSLSLGSSRQKTWNHPPSW